MQTSKPNARTNSHREKLLLGGLTDRYGTGVAVTLVPLIGEQGDDYGDVTRITIISEQGEGVTLDLGTANLKTLKELVDKAYRDAARDPRFV